MLLALGPSVTLASGGSCGRIALMRSRTNCRTAARRLASLQDHVDERVPHVRGAADRLDIGRPDSARITGSVTSVSISCGLRGHFT